jgi:uncharacterized cupin superfamily protein
MHKINTRDVPVQEQSSLHGKYRLTRQHLSIALGAKKDAGTSAGGHPFDVELVRLPTGAANFPLHQHSAQWELYLIIEGAGEARTGREIEPIQAGDVLMLPPEEAHQFVNTGPTDLVYYVIATNQPADITFYPETGKWAIKPQAKIFVINEVPYFEEGD